MTDKSQKGFLRQIWSKKAPWYTKIIRTGLMASAGIYLLPQMVEQLPGDPLPEGRKQALQDYYGETLDYSAIRLHSSAIANMFLKLSGAEALAFGETIVMRQKYDKLLPGNDNRTQYVLAHELGHVLQHKKHGATLGFSALWDKLTNLGKGIENLYLYSLEEGKGFAEYGIEQQAGILADYYNLSTGLQPLMLTDKVTGAEREQLYRTVLADFLKERGLPEKEKPAPAPTPAT